MLMYSLDVLGSRQNEFHDKFVIKWMQNCSISISSVTCLANFSVCVCFQLLILFTVMLLIGFEPAFSGNFLKKLNKELKKVNDPFFLIICIVIKSFWYIQMGFQTNNQDFLAKIGKNTVDIDNNATWTIVCSYHVVLSLWMLILF